MRVVFRISPAQQVHGGRVPAGADQGIGQLVNVTRFPRTHREDRFQERHRGFRPPVAEVDLGEIVVGFQPGCFREPGVAGVR